MRALAGLLVLAVLFAMAAGWQHRTGKRLQRQRTNEHGGPTLIAEQEEGWSRLVVGRPSGAEPIRVEPVPVRPGTASAPAASDSEVAPVEAVYTVRSGDVLGRICQDFYRSARPRLVDAVAAHNGLSNADALRVGQVLRLPSVDALLPGE